jgi:hypothetical protein
MVLPAKAEGSMFVHEWFDPGEIYFPKITIIQVYTFRKIHGRTDVSASVTAMFLFIG